MKSWVIRYLLPGIAALGLLLGVVMVYLSLRLPPEPPIPFPPPTSPFKHFIAGDGLVEANTENIHIGVPYSALVDHVFVSPGQYVQAGDPLFTLDTRTLEAELLERKAGYEVAVANYQKELALPRPEEVPPLVAAVEKARAEYHDRVAQYELFQNVTNPKAISLDEFNQRKFAAEAAKYNVEEVEARLAVLQAGAWIRDLVIHRAQVMEAKRRVGVVEADIEKAIIRAPFDGVVLRMNIRKGELAASGELTIPLAIFGPLNPLHIRVDIDEEDAWRVIKGAPGVAFVRGNSTIEVPLHFVRLEPFLIPKGALSGETGEAVDTRVLQVIYEFERDELPIYPGMLMDAFVEAKPNLGEE